MNLKLFALLISGLLMIATRAQAMNSDELTDDEGMESIEGIDSPMSVETVTKEGDEKVVEEKLLPLDVGIDNSDEDESALTASDEMKELKADGKIKEDLKHSPDWKDQAKGKVGGDKEDLKLKEKAEKLRHSRASLIEQVYRGKFPDKISKDLQQFGYDIFKQKVAIQKSRNDIPVDPDYLVGPGDAFTVNGWGAANFSHKVTVRKDGTIFLPKIGAIKVFGLSFDQMQAAVQKRASALYAGVKTHLNSENIRSIEVFVVGEVELPGSVNIPATSSPINALMAAGGPTKKGSLRTVQVLRKNRTIAFVDLYDFLISGTVNPVKLQSQDVILVPVVGQVVAVAGNVKRPAIYEFWDKTTLFDAIQMAGGLTFTGTVGRLSLDRVEDNRERVTKDYLIPENFKSLKSAEALKTDLGRFIEDGDLVKIFPVLRTLNNTVYLRGHVHRPGPYEFKQGMKLKDLIPSFEVLRAEPYTQFLQVIRTVPPRNEKLSVFVNLQKMLDGDEAANILIQEKDEIVVFSKTELDLKEKVKIAGRVNKPGDFYYFDGMKLRDLIFMAGNLTRDAYMTSAEISRYRILQNEIKMERIQVDLSGVLSDNPDLNPLLEPRDQVFIQSIQNGQMNNNITLVGEVKYPGTYSFLPGEKLSTVLERAGGYMPRAFLKGAIFTRESVKKFQEQTLKEQVNRLEQAIYQEDINPTRSVSAEDIAISKASSASRKALLDSMKNAKVTGRMVIQLEELQDFRNSKFDITLEPLDTLTIPSIPSVVTVMGEVYNQTSMIYLPGKTVQYYLDRSGGPTSNADTKAIMIIKSDGTVVSHGQKRGFLLKNFYQTKLDRGDSILVPKDISRFSWLSTTRDLTDIIFKVVSTTGITIAAFK